MRNERFQPGSELRLQRNRLEMLSGSHRVGHLRGSFHEGSLKRENMREHEPCDDTKAMTEGLTEETCNDMLTGHVDRQANGWLT